MPAGDAAFEGPALAVLDGDKVAGVVSRSRHNDECLTIKSPLLGREVERGFVDRVQPSLVLTGLLAGFLEGDGLPAHRLGDGCIRHYAALRRGRASRNVAPSALASSARWKARRAGVACRVVTSRTREPCMISTCLVAELSRHVTIWSAIGIVPL